MTTLNNNKEVEDFHSELRSMIKPPKGCDNCWGDLHEGCSAECRKDFKRWGNQTRRIREILNEISIQESKKAGEEWQKILEREVNQTRTQTLQEVVGVVDEYVRSKVGDKAILWDEGVQEIRTRLQALNKQEDE